MIRTRYAPTPSGYLHFGNLYSFILTATVARKVGAEILLRIDDMDMQRSRPEYLQDIYDCLRFFDLPWKKDLLQSKRLLLYQKALEELRRKHLVFACTCSRSMQQLKGQHGCVSDCSSRNISLDAPQVNWRFRTADRLITIKEYNGDVVQKPVPASLRHWVVRKKDGLPAYQLCSVVDDGELGIDLVIRGEDLWGSTIAQVELSLHLDTHPLANTHFLHHPLILDQEGKKLSKSDGADSLHRLRREGHSAAEILSLLARLITGNALPVQHWTDFEEILPLS